MIEIDIDKMKRAKELQANLTKRVESRKLSKKAKNEVEPPQLVKPMKGARQTRQTKASKKSETNEGDGYLYTEYRDGIFNTAKGVYAGYLKSTTLKQSLDQSKDLKHAFDRIAGIEIENDYLGFGLTLLGLTANDYLNRLANKQQIAQQLQQNVLNGEQLREIIERQKQMFNTSIVKNAKSSTDHQHQVLSDMAGPKPQGDLSPKNPSVQEVKDPKVDLGQDSDSK